MSDNIFPSTIEVYLVRIHFIFKNNNDKSNKFDFTDSENTDILHEAEWH